MKYILCQIGFAALLFAQSPLTEAKKRAMCDALLKEFTYLQDEAMQSYLQSLAKRMDSASVRIVDENEPWADYRPCGLILVTKGFLQKVSSERELAEAMAHMSAHGNQQPLTGSGWIPFLHTHHPRAIVPKSLESQIRELEAEARRRASEVMNTFATDAESAELRAFQQRYPPPIRTKPTLYR